MVGPLATPGSVAPRCPTFRLRQLPVTEHRAHSVGFEARFIPRDLCGEHVPYFSRWWGSQGALGLCSAWRV